MTKDEGYKYLIDEVKIHHANARRLNVQASICFYAPLSLLALEFVYAFIFKTQVFEQCLETFNIVAIIISKDGMLLTASVFTVCAMYYIHKRLIARSQWEQTEASRLNDLIIDNVFHTKPKNISIPFLSNITLPLEKK